jgi:hypothetical protein
LAVFAGKGYREEAKASANQITEVRSAVESAKSLEGGPQLIGMQPVGALQAMLVKLAREQHCELAEFQASADVAPYISNFAKAVPAGDWKQIEVHLTLKGSLNEVLNALRGMSDGKLLYEFSDVTLARDDAIGVSGSIQARVVMRVLTKSGGSA